MKALPHNLAIGNRGRLSVRLQEQLATLDEVVVVGYGEVRKQDLIGAVDQVSSKKIENLPVPSFDQALAGQSAGVQLRQGTGRPDAGAEILIRGVGSISGGNQPLIVIDGLPFGNYNGQTNNFLSLVNPNDIESISIVRDASGKAIYGSRAANGLIIIKTKGGRKGKPSIEFNTYTGVQTVPGFEKPDILNATELAQFLKERIEDQAFVNGTTPNIPDHLQDPSVYGEGTDWFDAITRDAWLQNVGLTIRGGTDNTKYSISAGYLNQDGMVIETNFKRYTLRANIETDITDWLHLGLNVAPSWTDSESGNTDPGGGQFSVYNVLNVARWADPTAPIYDENGQLTTTTRGALLPFFQANPVFKLKSQRNFNQNRQMLLGLNLKLDITDWLYFKTYAGTNLLFNNGRSFSPGSVVGTGLTPNNPDPPSNSRASASRYENLRLVSENTLNFNKTFNNHKIDALIGYSAELTRETFFNASGSRLIDENFELFTSGNIATNLPTSPDETRIFFSGGEGISEQALISYFGRANYSFKEKYYLTASLRVDGSSRFGPNNRFAPFPSVGGAWRISNESWFPQLDFVSNIRLEASWGKSGNNRIGNYAWQGSIAGADYVIGGGRAEGNFLGGIPNPNLSWEETEQLDIGIDLGLFRDRLSIGIDYFNQKTIDLLFAAPLPQITGYGSVLSNVGSIRNQGIELSISSQPVATNDLVWNLDANVSFNRNEVLQLGFENLTIRGSNAGNGTRVSITEVGQPVGQYYGLEILGLYTPEQIDDPNIPKYPGAVVGAPYYTDGDGDGILESEEDYVFIGDPWPDFTYGLTSILTYKNFQLRIIANGEVGSKIMDLSREFTLNTDGVFNVREEILNRWRPGDTDFSLRPPTTTSVPSSQRYRWPNSLGVADGTFLKISNITLNYNLSSVLDAIKFIKGGNVYFSVQNAFVFSEWVGNPEIRRANAGTLERNISYGSYPIPRTYTLGFNFNIQ